ncbi:CLUMA_CG000259, isoform A [Clunio marinus]|uniref:CLUMA_CG000259, isoform A n=1 Tax=Clunio marinus TaxID=568069 RepID=A0A1J1HES3_9DIPT|nr:CLUMA_CG000259, isoform A [Clunio marinus]
MRLISIYSISMKPTIIACTSIFIFEAIVKHRNFLLILEHFSSEHMIRLVLLERRVQRQMVNDRMFDISTTTHSNDVEHKI